MPSFHVKVANKISGESDEFLVEAESPEEAAKLANDQGWLVASVVEVPPSTPKPEPSPSASSTPKRSPVEGRNSPMKVFGAVIAIGSAVGLVLNTIASGSHFHAGRYLDMRFHSDNAMGATANALEYSLPDKLSDLTETIQGDLRDVKLIVAGGFGLILISTARRR